MTADESKKYCLGGKQINYAQSHQNDPLGAAIVLEVIRIIKEDGLIEQSKNISKNLISGLEDIKVRTNKIKAIRGRGLMVAVDLKDDANAHICA